MVNIPQTTKEALTGAKKIPALVATTAAAVFFATSEPAQAEVRPGCYTDGFGATYNPDRVVDENGVPCTPYTLEDIRARQEADKNDDNDRNTGAPVTPDPVTPDPVTPDPVTPDPVTPDPENPTGPNLDI